MSSGKHIDPEGQEYAYRVRYKERPDGPVWPRGARDLHDAKRSCNEIAVEVAEVWVERALLGDWERVG